MFRPLGENAPPPSEELSYFTNRVSEIEAFGRILEISNTQPIPLLMFYGVGGTGKSWMLKRLRQQIQTIPTAYLDLDPSSGDRSWGNDSSRAYAEIRRQLGDTVKCPRFDLAYTWLRYHEGRTDEPLFKGSGLLGNTWEFVVEAGSAAAEDIPGASIGSWLISKVTAPVNDWLSDQGVHDWLTLKLGQEDMLNLKKQLPSEIYPQLGERLLTDLQENLPDHNGRRARAVVFLDTIEAIREDRSSPEKLDSAQAWLRNLYHPESGLFVVMGGRDRLQWDRVDTAYANSDYLEQHLVGGLSKPDAVRFLKNCGISAQELQNAILAVSLDEETSILDNVQPQGYHPYSLGLCADTCHNLLARNKTVDHESFDMTSTDTHALAVRFLRSMGGDGAYAEWLKCLSLTPQFDETAARQCFSEHAGADQDAAWLDLSGYSFFRPTLRSGWYALHARMREALGDIQQRENRSLWEKRHDWWHSHWLSRSERPTDTIAAKAWYHTWCTEPDNADNQWNHLAEAARTELRMSDHFALLEWWSPCEFDTSADEEMQRHQHASALNSLGLELTNATLGDKAANVQRAIECYAAALRVYTQQAFPQEWAATQNNLAVAYCALPSGDKAVNAQRAIECLESALLVYTEQAFPQLWATTQNNLAIAYRNLPSGDKAANVQRAIECLEAALRVRTERAFPQDWALAQNNLAIAYVDLPSGDKAANVQRAIVCLEGALRVYTEQTFPQDWAMTQNNLANAYRDLPSGDKAANVQRAIVCLEGALRVYTEQAFPQLWARTQNNLAITHCSLPSGNKAANVQRGIECSEATLRVFTEQAFPQDWAKTQNNLAIAYRNLPSGDKAANVKRAIEYFKAALRVRTEQAFPKEWAMTQNNMAIAYCNLPNGDKAANVQRAIECFEAALQVFTEKAFPQQFKIVMSGLKNARAMLESSRTE